MDGRRGKDWGVHEVLGTPGGPTLGSTIRRVEPGGTCAGAHRTWTGRFSDTDTGKSGMKRFGRGEGY